MEKVDYTRQLKMVASLGALHAEDSFRLRAYERAAEALARIPDEQLLEAVAEWPEVEGLGNRLRASLTEAQRTGLLPQLEELQAKTPASLQKLVQLRGLSPSKLGQLWRALDTTTAEEVEIACRDGRVARQKGFGEKSAERLLSLLLFHKAQQGQLRWTDALQLAEEIETTLQDSLPELRLRRSGLLARSAEILCCLEWTATHTDHAALKSTLEKLSGCVYLATSSGPFTLRAEKEVELIFYLCEKEQEARRRFISSSSSSYLSLRDETEQTLYAKAYGSPFDEASLHKMCNMPQVPPPLREAGWSKEQLTKEMLDGLLQAKDLQGVLHCHSHYSDGKDSLRDMALYARELGYHYLGISDHSRSAFYANGLQTEDIEQQFEEIEKLNEELAPFRIFKGIECDILPDGSMDYAEEILKKFDFVIASVHSQLHMDKTQATERLLRAISNPYTQILAHMSGRLLLERPAYALDYTAVLEACAKYKVAIEFNANPYRLDIDWRWIAAAQEVGVRLCVNPDAHSRKAISVMLTSLPIAQKGGLQRNMTLNALDTEVLSAHFSAKKKQISP